MSITSYIGRIGRIGRIGAVAVAVLVATATAFPAPVSQAVRPAADTTVLAVCGATCPQWPAADVDRIIDEFVTPLFPTAPGGDITSVAVRTRGESWPLTGILRLLGLAVGDPRIFGPGGGSWPNVPWWKLTGLFDLTGDQSIRAGTAALEQAIAAATPGNRLVIYALSQGVQSTNTVRDRLTAQYSDGTPAPDIDFILEGDARVPNGGLLSRFPGFYLPILDWTFNGPEQTDTPFDTVVVNRQYDGFADFPLYPLNLVATLNAVLGIVYLHTWPFGLDIPAGDPAASPAYQGKDGRTSYYLFDSDDLPLFGPLRSLGVPERFIDVIEPFFRVLVESGYDRSIDPWEPTPARLIPRFDPVKLAVDLINAIGEGINNALAIVGVPPLVRTPTPAIPAPSIPQTAKVGISPQLTSRRAPTETEQEMSTRTETDTRQISTNVTTSTAVTETTKFDVPRQRAASELQGATDLEHPPSMAVGAVEPGGPMAEDSTESASTTKQAEPRLLSQDSLESQQRPDRLDRGDADQPTVRTRDAEDADGGEYGDGGEGSSGDTSAPGGTGGPAE